MTKINHWGQWQAEKTNPLPEERRMERPTDPALMNGYWRKVGARTEFDEPIVIWTEEDAERNPDGWSTVLQWGFDEKNNHWSTPHIIDETSKRWVSFIGVGWLKCIAVSKADWSVAVETGRWPDGKPARRMSTEEKLGIDVEAGLIAPTAYRTIFTTPTAGMAELAALARSSYCELAIADPVLAKVLVTPRVSVGPLMLARLRMYAREAGAPEPAVTVVAVALLEAEAAARRGLAAVVDALMLGVAPRRVLVVGTDAECAAVISAGELAAFFAPREWWA